MTPKPDYADLEELTKAFFTDAKRIFSRQIFPNSTTSFSSHNVSLPASFEYDGSLVSAYRNILATSDANLRNKQTHSEFLSNHGFLIDGKLTLAGKLLFTKVPTKYLESAWTQCSFYFGAEKTRKRSISNVTGPLPEQLDKILEFVEKNTRLIAEPLPGTMQANEAPEYPMTAIREIVANALCHRDYGDAQRWSSIAIYSDRIEVKNPGDWPPAY